MRPLVYFYFIYFNFFQFNLFASDLRQCAHSVGRLSEVTAWLHDLKIEDVIIIKPGLNWLQQDLQVVGLFLLALIKVFANDSVIKLHVPLNYGWDVLPPLNYRWDVLISNVKVVSLVSRLWTFTVETFALCLFLSFCLSVCLSVCLWVSHFPSSLCMYNQS